MPLFSIIIPTFNPDRHDFHKCLRSIAEQEFTDYEVVVVDDGSDDPCAIQEAVSESECKSKVMILRLDNGGPYAARRRGIDVSVGRYVVSVDDDDELIGTDALQLIASALEQAAFPDYLLINATRDKKSPVGCIDYSSLDGDALSSGVRSIETKEFNRLFICNNDYNSACCKVIRRAMFPSASETLPRVVMADDRCLCLDFLPNAQTAGLLDIPLYFYRPTGASITRSAYKAELFYQVNLVEEKVRSWVISDGYNEREWARGFLLLTSNHLNAISRNAEYTHARLAEIFKTVVNTDSVKRALVYLDDVELKPAEYRQLALLKTNKFNQLVIFMIPHAIKSKVIRFLSSVKKAIVR